MADEKLTKFTKQDVKIAPIEVLYSGFFNINLYQFEHALFAGGNQRLSVVRYSNAVTRLQFYRMIP